MGVISAGTSNDFKPASFIYSKIRRFLKSFDAANLIDEGEFPTYAKEVLKGLGIGVYMEEQTLIPIKNFKASLPDNFEYLYVAYKCTPFTRDSDKGNKRYHQNTGFGFSTEITKTITESQNCEIICCEKNTEVIETISVQNYVNGGKEELSFSNITPLRLSPNVSKDICMGDYSMFLNSSPLEITINNKIISTNFNDDFIYMKYYAFPINEDGDILVPNIESVEKTIEWYSIYQILLSGWFNSTIPDIQNKTQYAEMQYEKYRAESKYINKLPSFAEMVNIIRTKKGLNSLVYFTDQMRNTNFQRSR